MRPPDRLIFLFPFHAHPDQEQEGEERKFDIPGIVFFGSDGTARKQTTRCRPGKSETILWLYPYAVLRPRTANDGFIRSNTESRGFRTPRVRFP
jgi:hypothetical protein